MQKNCLIVIIFFFCLILKINKYDSHMLMTGFVISILHTYVSKQSKTGIAGTNRQLLIIEKRNVNWNRSRLQWRLVEVSDMEGMTQSVGIVTCCLYSLVHMVSAHWSDLIAGTGLIEDPVQSESEHVSRGRERERLSTTTPNTFAPCRKQPISGLELDKNYKRVLKCHTALRQKVSGGALTLAPVKRRGKRQEKQREREIDWEMACLLSIWRGQRALW